jgi:hypothetical protein
VASRRLRRVVLVSDGVDAPESRAEGIIVDAYRSGISLSVLGIGADFDDTYLRRLAGVGHGEMVNPHDERRLLSSRSLHEVATTNLERLRVDLVLPSGIEFVGATGADVERGDGHVVLFPGSPPRGEERRILVELNVLPFTTSSAPGSSPSKLEIVGNAQWVDEAGRRVSIELPRVGVVRNYDAASVRGVR